MITYFQAVVIDLIQGVTELFPISSTVGTPREIREGDLSALDD